MLLPPVRSADVLLEDVSFHKLAGMLDHRAASRESVVDIGPIHATADREPTMPLPPVVGIAAVAGVVLLLIVGVRNSP